MTKVLNQYFDKNYWINEAAIYYSRPYLRLEKCARLVNRLANGKEVDLLDVGCGPAALSKLLEENIHYHGIDIAVHTPGENIIELDIVKQPINFRNQQFDLVVATGLFEYMGKFTREKLSEIRKLMKPGGKFILSYTNFRHLHAVVDYTPYNYVVPIDEFKRDLEQSFTIRRFYPTFYNWRGTEPRKRWSYLLQKHVTVNLPIVNQWFAVSYFFVCEPK